MISVVLDSLPYAFMNSLACVLLERSESTHVKVDMIDALSDDNVTRQYGPYYLLPGMTLSLILSVYLMLDDSLLQTWPQPLMYGSCIGITISILLRLMSMRLKNKTY